MPETQDPPPSQHRLTGWPDRIPIFRQLRLLTSSAPSGMRHTGGLVDIFASFVSLDNQVDRAEAEVALDLLRHAFPEADHGWLARRLHRALASPQPPEVVAASMRGLDPDEHVSLGLQLYLLVITSGSAFRGREAFTKVMRSLDATEVGDSILREMNSEPHKTPLPFDKVLFSSSEQADILLPPSSSKYTLCAYRSKDLILIRNSGKEPIWISGSSLATGQCMRLRPHQSITLPNWTLTAEDVSFFLNSSRTGHRQTLYLNENNGKLTADRTRSRQSTIRLDFGLNVHIEALLETSIRLISGEALEPGTTYELPFQDKLLLASGAEASLESLRRQAMETGRRFKMDSGSLECTVSNDPSELKRGDLLLAPGLAARTILRIKYNAQTAEGDVSVISAGSTITVNGKIVRKSSRLVDGALIRLSPNQAVRCRFSEGLLDEERAVIRDLSVENLTHRFGADRTVLDNVAFSVSRGEMLCIMGPSGSGKSTLLSVLASHLKPTRGHVRLNGVSLYTHRSRLAPFIASMPQEEALNPQLTVREHLSHACTVRRPHLSSREHAKRVDSILAELTLQPLARRRVGSADDKTLSGGERGRLNLGLDLSSAAEIFLFDEPISGLSSKDSEHVAETLHALSRDNIVIASLHRPGARVLRLFDKVLMLDQGGRVAFFGTPMAMAHYFREACHELNIMPPQRLNNQQAGADFVFDVLETPLHGPAGREGGGARRFPPTFWQERFEGSQLVDEVARGGPPDQSKLGDVPLSQDHMAVPSRPRRQRLAEWHRLLRTHFTRSLASKFRNRGTIYSILLEAPLLALLIGATLRASPDGPYAFHSGLHLPVYIFLTATIGMFLGLTNSATEILRDSPVLRRERNYRTGTFLYVTAKFLALAILALLQCGIYTWIGQWMLDIHGMFLVHWGWMTITALCGTAMALLVSSIVTTERAALSSVPLLLVPQILLAGALVSFDEMNRGLFEGGDEARAAGAEPIPSRFMPLRYAYEGMIVSQATMNPFEKQRRKIQKDIDSLKKHTELTPEETERLTLLKASLRRLMAAESVDVQSADKLTWELAHAGRKKTMNDLLAIPPYPKDENIPSKPVRDFFVNTRTDLLVTKAEIDRVDYRVKHKRSIFLAEWKYWLGMATETIHACLWIIATCISGCLFATMLFLQRKTQRTK